MLNEIGYLELRADGLGRRFFGEVRKAEDLIYTIEKDGLVILAVAHRSRRPGYWVGRLAQTEDEG